MLTMVRVSNHYLENCRSSCGDTNSTIQYDAHTDGRTHTGRKDVRMTEGKTIGLPSLRGGGIIYFKMSSADCLLRVLIVNNW